MMWKPPIYPLFFSHPSKSLSICDQFQKALQDIRKIGKRDVIDETDGHPASPSVLPAPRNSARSPVGQKCAQLVLPWNHSFPFKVLLDIVPYLLQFQTIKRRKRRLSYVNDK